MKFKIIKNEKARLKKNSRYTQHHLLKTILEHENQPRVLSRNEKGRKAVKIGQKATQEW